MSTNNNNCYEETYYLIPRYIRRLSGITLAYLDIYETIFQFWNKGKNCFLSEESLCERTGYQRAIIYRALSFFEKHNELKRINKDGKRYLVRPEKIYAIDCTENVPKSTAVDTNVYGCRLSTSTAVDHNIKKLNKEVKNNIPDSANTGGKNVLRDYQKDERFMQFYSEYPKKEDPQDAWKAFKAIVGDDDELLDRIISDIQQRKQKHTQWQDRQYIKHPAVYLRKGEYLGEIFNAGEAMMAKKQKQETENQEIRARQEEESLKRADEARKHHALKQSDASAYRNVMQKIPSKTTQDALKGLKRHLKKG